MSFITAIIECLTGTDTTAPRDTMHATTLDGDTKGHIHYQTILTSQDEAEVAQEFLELLRSAETSGEELKLQLQSVIHTHGWTENLAQRILNGVVRVIEENREKIGPVMREALIQAENAATELFTFAKEHPYQTAGYAIIVAVGILVPYAPWIIRALGFGARGPILGSFAAWWESTYAGYIPARSVFSYLQRLGMTWATAEQVTRNEFAHGHTHAQT